MSVNQPLLLPLVIGAVPEGVEQGGSPQREVSGCGEIAPETQSQLRNDLAVNLRLAAEPGCSIPCLVDISTTALIERSVIEQVGDLKLL